MLSPSGPNDRPGMERRHQFPVGKIPKRFQDIGD
jgi:hypothetical protein